MIINFAICDDEKTQTDYLSGLAREWAASGKNAARISVFDSAEAFMFAYEADKSFDVLLLDIQMKGVDGVTLAKRLRTGDSAIQIIFVTGLADFIGEGYEVSALHYLLKPVRREKLWEALDRAVAAIGRRDASVLTETAEGPVRLFVRDIQYAEAFAHTTTLHTSGGAIDARISISELEEALGEEFFRAHRSYVVGLRHIRQITKTEIAMDDGAKIPLSRRRYDMANRAFINYYKGGR